MTLGSTMFSRGGGRRQTRGDDAASHRGLGGPGSGAGRHPLTVFHPPRQFKQLLQLRGSGPVLRVEGNTL